MTQIPSLVNLLSPYNIVIYMLVFTRITGLMVSAPFFSSIQAPMMTKIWFSATIAFIMYPLVFASKNFIMPHSMLCCKPYYRRCQNGRQHFIHSSRSIDV